MTFSCRLRPTDAKNAAAARGSPASTDGRPSSAIGAGPGSIKRPQERRDELLARPDVGREKETQLRDVPVRRVSQRRGRGERRLRAPHGGRQHQSELARAQTQQPVLVAVVQRQRDRGERPRDDHPGEQDAHRRPTPGAYAGDHGPSRPRRAGVPRKRRSARPCRAGERGAPAGPRTHRAGSYGSREEVGAHVVRSVTNA